MTDTALFFVENGLAAPLGGFLGQPWRELNPCISAGMNTTWRLMEAYSVEIICFLHPLSVT